VSRRKSSISWMHYAALWRRSVSAVNVESRRRVRAIIARRRRPAVGHTSKTRRQKGPAETGGRNGASIAKFRTRRPAHICETSRYRAVFERSSYVTRWRRTGWLGREDSNICISESECAKTLSSGREDSNMRIPQAQSERHHLRQSRGKATTDPLPTSDCKLGRKDVLLKIASAYEAASKRPRFLLRRSALCRHANRRRHQ